MKNTKKIRTIREEEMFDSAPNLEYLRSFSMVVKYGSVAGAVNKSKLSLPTLSRHIKLLEAELGASLFSRTNNGMMITEIGEQVYATSKILFQTAADLRSDVLQSKANKSGIVKIVASTGIAAIILPKIFNSADLLSSDIQLHLATTHNVTDELLGENDIAIQTHRPTNLNLIASRIGEIALGAYASATYLDLMGEPGSLSDLKDHHIVGGLETKSFRDLINQSFGSNVSNQAFHLSCENHSVAWQMVRAGCGIGFTHISYGDNEPLVKRVLKILPTLDLPIWLVAHQEINNSHRIRFIYDLISNGINKA